MLAANPAYKQIEVRRSDEWYVEGVSRTFSSYAPVPVSTLDGVDMKLDACVVMDKFPPGICSGPQELRCYNINRHEPTGVARIDNCASLVVSFLVPDNAPISLRGFIDARIAVQTGAMLRPYRIDLYATYGKTIKAFGMVERLRFQLAGYELETNFEVVDDAMGVEDFLLCRNFPRTYKILVNLTAMRIMVRAPVKPVWQRAHTQFSDSDSAVPIASAQEVVLQPV